MKRACILIVFFSILPLTVLAQAQEIGRIALYADELRTTSEVNLSTPYTPFDVYIFCQPSENGTYCAEFGVASSNSSMIISAVEWHQDLSVVLGDMATGVSACLLECQTDWFYISRVTMLSSSIDPATIDIVRHQDVGYYQFANCLPDNTIEPIFNGPGLSFNSSSTPDTDPPVPVSVVVEDDIHLTLYFDEKVFEPDALDPASYSIYSTDGSLDTVPVGFALLQGEEDRVWMVLSEPLAASPYNLELNGLRDIAGNPSAPGTFISFGGMDTTPPELLDGYAPDANTALLVFSETLRQAPAENISNYTTGCDACPVIPQPVSATLQPDGRSVALTLAPPMEQEWIYDVTARNITDLSGNMMSGSETVSFKAPDSSPPVINQVSYLADTSLAIIWNEALDPVSAADLMNYSFFRDGPPADPMTLVSAVLVSGIYVRLNFEPAIDPMALHTLFVSGVMDTSMNVMYPDTIHMASADSIPPVLLDAECMGLLDVDLTFNESVDTRSWSTSPHQIQIYPAGNPWVTWGIDGFTMLFDNTVIRIHLTNELVPGADYTVLAVDIMDYAGNFAPDMYRDFSCNDIYPPDVISVYLSDQTHVNVRFDEVVDEGAEDPANYTLHEAADSTALVGVTAAVLHDGGTRALLTTAAPLVLGEMYALRISGVGDLLGHMIDPDTLWTFMAEDIVVPVLLNVTTTSDSIIHLEFNEPLDPGTAEDLGKYAVVSYYDTSNSLALRSATLDPGGTRVDLELDGHGRTERSYVVWIMGVTDIAGNALFDESSIFIFHDTFPPLILYADGVSTRKVRVYFDQTVSTTAEQQNNYSLYPVGDPSAGIEIFLAYRGLDESTVSLILGEDMIQETDYALAVSGIEDNRQNVMEPDTAYFHFLDDRPPEIQIAYLVNPLRLSIEFDEPVDSATAIDPGNYSIYLSTNVSQQIAVNSIDWLMDEVRLDLASEPVPNIQYTVRIDGVEDRFGNACSGLEADFRHDVYVPSATIGLYTDNGSHDVDVEAFQPFSFFVWVDPGGYGVFAVEYALTNSAEAAVYVMTGLELNSQYGAISLGDPYNGHSVALSNCATSLFWLCRLDCLCLVSDVQDIVWPIPHPDTGEIQIANCLPGHPMETVAHAYPLIINGQYVATMLDRWDASFRSGGIELIWSIMDTKNNPDFEVSRSLDGSEAWQPLDSGLILGDGLNYSLLDSGLEFGLSYRYRVECIEDDGRKILFETDAISTPVMPLALNQNSPNPFNPSTNISFYLPQAGHVRLEIFDVNGRLVDVLVDAQFAGGEHSIDWDGRDRGGSSVSSGVYFYRLIAGKESLSRKMVLMR